MIFGRQIKHFIKITRKNPTQSKKGINGQKMLLKGVTGYVRTAKNVSTPKVGVLNVEFALKLRIYRSLKVLFVSNES